MDALLYDLRYALRSLRSSPGFAATVIITLALGIGANTAIFSVVNGVILRPLPYVEPDRLVMIWEENPRVDFGVRHIPTSPGNFARFREERRVLADAGAFRYTSAALTGQDESEQLWGAELTPSMFTTLGVRAALGRVFTAEEELPGRGDVVLLSHGLWQRKFGGDPRVLGRVVEIDGVRRTVIGVMPEAFRFPLPSMYPIHTRVRSEYWIPHSIDPGAPQHGVRNLGVIARLRDGASLEMARAALLARSRRLAEEFPGANRGWTAVAIPLAEHVAAPVRPALLLLLGAVALVLLVACANVANLLLVRATKRQRELTIRAALGASGGRIVRQVLTESLVLAVGGGVLGLVVVVWATDALRALLPAGFPRAAEVGIDGPVLGFSLLAALMTGLIFGVGPALRAARVNVATTLGEGGRRTIGDRRAHRARSLLVIAQVALAIMLLVGAGLLARSFARLTAVDPGFDPQGLVTASVSPSAREFPDADARRAGYEAIVSAVGAIPGVSSAALASLAPFSEEDDFYGFVIEGRERAPDAPPPEGRVYVVSAAYFEAMRIPVGQGRGLTAADAVEAPPVVVVNRRLVETYFPGEDAIGRRVQVGSNEWRTIVGVVENTSFSGLDVTARPELYVPMQQRDARDMILIARATCDADAGRREGGVSGAIEGAALTPGVPAARECDPLALATPLRAAVRTAARGTPLGEVRSMESLIASSLAQRRLSLTLLGAFGLLAIVLASLGIYGVLACLVAERTREIGIRRALGALDAQVVRMVVGHGLAMTAIGLVIGGAAALAATRAIRGMLYGVGASDPLTFILVAALVATVALLASWLPARRAARVHPVEALKGE